MIKGKRITQGDIARAAGVSVMTVSRALRHDPAVAKKTAERVREVAEELDYKPDPVLSSLVAYRQQKIPPKDFHVIAYLTDSPTPDRTDRPSFSHAVFLGAQAYGEKIGFKLEKFWLKDPRLENRDPSDVLEARGIVGLIVPPPSKIEEPPRLDWSRFASVAISTSLREPRLDFVTSDHFQSMSLVMRELRKQGYRRIGLHMYAHSDLRTRHRWEAAYAFQNWATRPEDRVPPFHPDPIADGRYDYFEAAGGGRPSEGDGAAIHEAFHRWVKDYGVEVIITLAGPHNIADMGINVPDEVGVVNLGVPDPNGEVSGIYQQTEAIGTAAVERVKALMSLNRLGVPEIPQGIYIPGKWVQGQSIRPLGTIAE